MSSKYMADAFHLMSRAGFGMNAFYLSQLPLRNDRLYSLLAEESTAPFAPIQVAANRYEVIQKLRMAAAKTDTEGTGMNMGAAIPKLSAEDRMRLQKGNREDLKNMSLAWQEQMVNSKAQLREKMALFWHGHFAARDQNLFFQQQLLQEIRAGALGNFRDLLLAVSKSATMLGFLNNRQNRKNKPNENFAREVMELFTLGRGNYSEQDVKEAARAFTGWTHGPAGTFLINRRQHDDGIKTIFGQTGNFGGEEVLDMLLKKPETAYFLTRKICRYLVNDNPEEAEVRRLADYYHKTDYDTGKLLEKLFTGKWFYAAENRGNLIKSPVQFFIGMQRQLPVELLNPEVTLVLQRGMGQLLFLPPNVAGWPGGKSWIDSSSLMLRMRIPQMLAVSTPVALKLKSDDDVQMGLTDAQAREASVPAVTTPPAMSGRQRGNQYLMRSRVDWESYTARFENIPRATLFQELCMYLLPNVSISFSRELIESVSDNSSRQAYIKSVTITIMSTPEYQLS